MAEPMTCFACDQEPTQQCSRCGRPYCDEHGEELCDACLEPASGVPSFTLYRGSLLALLIGAALAIWLLIQPSSSEGDASLQPIILTPTSPAAANQTPGATRPAGAATTPAAGTTATPAAGATRSPTPPTGGTSTPGGTAEYTVASGDTLSSICERVKPASMTIADCVDRVVALNSLPNANSISPGDKLKVPR
jgi:hypothetical protein